MLNIAVCDDEEMVLPYLCEQISSAFERVHMEVRIDSYSSSIKLRKTIENRISYDVFFLDIDMKELDGFRLASFIENKLEEAVLIFVSSKEEYVFSSFRHHPFSFIRKEKLRQDLEITVTDLQKKLKCENGNDRIILTDEQQNSYEFPVQDVLYIEAQDKYICIHTTNGNQVIRSSLSAAEKTLKDTCFMRIHKSYMINLHMIYAIFYDKVVMDDKTELPVGREKVQMLRQRFCEET